jgi:hypothetical protein
MARKRYEVRNNVPVALRKLGFVAYVTDFYHPDLEKGDASGLSVSWHQSDADACRTASALNNCGDAVRNPIEQFRPHPTVAGAFVVGPDRDVP